MQAVGALLKAMPMVLQMVGAETELGQAVAKALVDIGKHLKPGASSPQGEDNFMKQMMARNQQMRPQMAALQAQQMRPGPAMPQPMPSAPGGGGAPG